MDYVFLCAGVPFDPTIGATQTKLPSNLRITGNLKRIAKFKPTRANCAEYANEIAVEYARVTLQRIGRLGEFEADGEVDLSKMKKHCSEAVSIMENKIKKNLTLAISRGAEAAKAYNVVLNPPLFSEYLEATWGREHGVLKDIMRNNDALTQSHFDKVHLVSDAHGGDDNLTTLFGGDKQALKAARILAYTLNAELENRKDCDELDTKFVFIGISASLQSKANRKTFIQGLWLACLRLDTLDTFVLLVKLFPSWFTDAEFPFLNFRVIEEYAEYMRSTYEVENFDDMIAELLFEANVSLMNEINDCPISSMGCNSAIQKQVYLYKFTNHDPLFIRPKDVIAHIISLLNGVNDRLGGLIDTAPSKEMSARINQKFESIGDGNLLKTHETVIFDFLQDVMRFESNYIQKIDIVVADKERSVKWEEQIESIENEASELAKDALNNLTALTSLKTQKDSLELEMIDFNKTLDDDAATFSSKVDGLFSTLESVVDGIQLDIIQALVEEDPTLELDARVSDLTSQLSSVKQALSRKEAVVVSTQETLDKINERNKAVNLNAFEEHMAIMDAKGIKDIVDLLMKRHPDRIMLSSECVKSLKTNPDYARLSTLYYNLSVLVSDVFIDTYLAEGSAACFNLLTSGTLSWQESATTRQAQLRNFRFDEVGSRECKAHLKIGVDAKFVQRVYFSILDGKVLIGDITNHAPT